MQAEKIVDMQEYKHVNKLYTYDEVINLSHQLAAKEIEQEKKERKMQFWDEMFVAIPMASVFIALWFALLLGF